MFARSLAVKDGFRALLYSPTHGTNLLLCGGFVLKQILSRSLDSFFVKARTCTEQIALKKLILVDMTHDRQNGRFRKVTDVEKIKTKFVP